MTHVIPVGTSEPQDFALKNDGVALVGTGFTIGLEMFTLSDLGVWDAIGSPMPTVAWLSQAAGTVRVTGLEGLSAGTYAVRFTLEDGSGTIGYAPNGLSADTWRIVLIPGSN